MGTDSPPATRNSRCLPTGHYGLGKSVAVTSDALSKTDRKTWDRDWADSQMYEKFWEQVVGWAIRALETGRFSMTNEYRDGKVKVIVDAARQGQSADHQSDLPRRHHHAGGEDAKIDLRFEQKNSGVYEADFKQTKPVRISSSPRRRAKRRS